MQQTNNKKLQFFFVFNATNKQQKVTLFQESNESLFITKSYYLLDEIRNKFILFDLLTLHQ